jgi:hypothetical protein
LGEHKSSCRGSSSILSCVHCLCKQCLIQMVCWYANQCWGSGQYLYVWDDSWMRANQHKEAKQWQHQCCHSMYWWLLIVNLNSSWLEDSMTYWRLQCFYDSVQFCFCKRAS